MRICCFLLMISLSFHSSGETTFTYMSPKSDKDVRNNYDVDLFRLALEMTIESHGPYRLIISPLMNHKRAFASLETSGLTNFFVKQSISKSALDKYGAVKFPVDLGIVGYRVFFVSPNAKSSFQKVTTLTELKQFSIGQGLGWLDTQILRDNGFKVIEGTSYEGLFKMVARSRVDLFGRGANEILSEYQARANDLQLIADTSIILYYPLPRFFFTSKKNLKAIQRVQTGLELAYKNGSLYKLWHKHYSASVSFVNFQKSKIFKIENPFLKGIDDSYKQYIFTPAHLNNQ